MRGDKILKLIFEDDLNLREQVMEYIDSLLQNTFEKGLVQNVANRVDGYDTEWSANNYDNSYREAKDAFINSVTNTLFANFNNK